MSAICKAAGVSRKTGYQWASRLDPRPSEEEAGVQEELVRLKAEHEELEKRFDDVRFENEGRKLAWRLHDVDELLASKKNTMRPQRGPK